jgi:hypothetical protein
VTWLIVGLLVAIVVLLGVIAWTLEKGLEWIADLTRASGQANIRVLNQIYGKLDQLTDRGKKPLSMNEIFGPLLRRAADEESDTDPKA